MKNLFYRLLIYLDSANETDTNYNIAWYMAHHISEVAHMGISKLASECFVSPATISRFCRACTPAHRQEPICGTDPYNRFVCP